MCVQWIYAKFLKFYFQTMAVPGPNGSSRSTVTVACSKCRTHLYADSCCRGPAGGPRGLCISG